MIKYFTFDKQTSTTSPSM